MEWVVFIPLMSVSSQSQLSQLNIVQSLRDLSSVLGLMKRFIIRHTIIFFCSKSDMVFLLRVNATHTNQQNGRHCFRRCGQVALGTGKMFSL